MVVLLVILTFVILLAVGIMMERRENRERQEARGLRRMAQQAVFAQDGGEPIDKEKAHEEMEKDA
jgi:type II secretory pathway pseudopilin PulG